MAKNTYLRCFCRRDLPRDTRVRLRDDGILHFTSDRELNSWREPEVFCNLSSERRSRELVPLADESRNVARGKLFRKIARENEHAELKYCSTLLKCNLKKIRKLRYSETNLSPFYSRGLTCYF